MSNVPIKRLNKDDAVVLLVDHQTGLISLVQDFSPNEFKNNVLALADLAKFFELPTILTTSFENGPNGPLVPELKEMFPDAPRSEEHTSELQSLMRLSYAVFCLKKTKI